MYVSIGAVKTSLLISYFFGMLAHKNLKNFSPHSVGFKILFWLIFSIGLPINLLKFEWKNESELELSLIFKALKPIFKIFEGSSNQSAVGITPGDDVIFGIDSNDLAKRGESLIRKSTNRYLTTVKIAFRAKQRRFDDFDGLLEESTIKPVQRSIIELSDEQDQPDLLPG